jgi:hypothetical protein
MDKTFLYSKGFKEPNLVDYNHNGLQIFFKNDEWFVTQNGVQWMAYSKKNYNEVFHVYSHWLFAEGHCICTGLGLALRENWILTKKEVSKLTVIENNLNIIDYHYKNNRDIFNKLDIIHADVYEYTGVCDTLLIDNFEGGIEYEAEFCHSAKLISEKIYSNKMWFWPLEYFLIVHYRNYIGLSLEEIYYKIKTFFKLDKLPNLNEEQLFELCYWYYGGNLTKCDFKKLSI